MRPGIKFLNSLFEVTHVEYQTYDLCNHQLIFSSGMAHQLLGYTEEEYFTLSKDFYKNIIHPDDCQIVVDTIDKIIQSKKGEVFEMTIRMRKSNATYIWANSRQMVIERRKKYNSCKIIREVEDVTSLINIQNELEARVRQLKEVSYKNSHLLPIWGILLFAFLTI